MLLEQELQIESNLTRLPDAVNWFETFHRPQLPAARWEQAKLALIEAFTNAVRHAQHPQASSDRLCLKAALSDDSFWFEIWDQGAPYDLDWALTELGEALQSPSYHPLEREKHWGNVIFLRLMQNFNWVIHYSRHDTLKNCFRAEVSLTRRKQAQQQF